MLTESIDMFVQLTVMTCFLSQIGSYFGSTVCAVDIDKDSLTDILLVGAPMYMGTAKEEQGRVYVYSLKEVIYSQNIHQLSRKQSY